jgi:hypothetical protein
MAALVLDPKIYSKIKIITKGYPCLKFLGKSRKILAPNLLSLSLAEVIRIESDDISEFGND